MTILNVENLKVNFNTYRGKVKAVRNVSFYLKSGETLVTVGESGCGKTVMGKSIIKLLPDKITEIGSDSKIMYRGENLLEKTEEELENIRGRKISMIFQDPMTYLNPTMRIGNQIAECLECHRKYDRKYALEKTLEILDMVKIDNGEKRMNQYPHEFSGGMRQRVIIAIALSCHPEILIADEPTTALDVTTQADIIELIKELQKKLGMSVMLITHNLGLAAEVADRIQIMYAGSIVETGKKEDIFRNPKHPYTLALLNSVPSLEKRDSYELYSLDGTPPDLILDFKGCAFKDRCSYCMEICKNKQPETFLFGKKHLVRCWLYHPYAPKVENINKEL